LYVVFKTMAPTMGNIHDVTIYLSDFGAQKLKEETLKGPMNVFMTDEEFGNFKIQIIHLRKSQENGKRT
jgi:hypothetical protein